MYIVVGSDSVKNYIANNDIILIDYLVQVLNYKHKDAKRKLAYEQVLINNKVITKYNYLLHKNDQVMILDFKSSINDNIKILYEDKNIIVVNKPFNLLTVSSSKEKERTMYHIVSDYLKHKNKNSKVFVIHRLDKDTSGIVMFAKSEKIKQLYQNNWDNLVIYRGYIAVVQGKLENKSGTIAQYLAENKNCYVYKTSKNLGKLAITHYKVIKSNSKYSLLNIEIKTGRKNQIRVALKSIGHPIVGDLKYGTSNNSLKRLGLCANKLIIIDPINNKELNFQIDIPSEFMKIVT